MDNNLPISKALDASSCAITIADASKPDFPLVYVNKSFEKITGYPIKESVGRNCRFLQGDLHDQAGLKKLRKAITQQKEITVVLKNFKKSGEMFWNELRLSPVFNAKNKLTHYIGIQTDVTERIEAQNKLKKYQTELENMVKERTEEVVQKNTALKEILSQLEIEKKQIQDQVIQNMDQLVMPLLRRLGRKVSGPKEKQILNLIEENVMGVTEKFGQQIGRKLYGLTPREIEICNMIRGGLSTKDIAQNFNVSLSTVENQRNTIRKKLGVSKKNVNLTTYLLSFS